VTLVSRPTGNTRLKSARLARGYGSQQALADAMARAAGQLGIRGFAVGVRQIRRWESANPPWPGPDQQRVLTHVLGTGIEALGFTPPWTGAPPTGGTSASVPAPAVNARGGATAQPDATGDTYAAITHAHRALYWTVAPAQLHPAVRQHAQLGTYLLPEMTGPGRAVLAAALAETHLMAGRIEFFDLNQPDTAADTYVAALQAAGEADDALLGAAVLAHSAFVPGWASDRDGAAERMAAARAYARRGPAPALLLAWLDAVEAECETRCGQVRTALNLIHHAETVLADDPGEHPVPAWLDWFTPVRLAAFKGNTQLRAGHLPQARATLHAVLDALPGHDGKQRTVILGDLAAVAAASGDPAEACAYATQALDQLARTWYATGMERVREVRRALTPWQGERCVRDLDDRLYGWQTTLSALQRR
jgi:hypothetical protein